MVQAVATTRDRRTAWRNTPDSRFSCGRIACQVFLRLPVSMAAVRGAPPGRLHALAVAGRYVDGSHRQVAFDGHLRAIGILLPIEAHRMGKLFTGLAVEVLFTAGHTQGYSCVVDDHRDALEGLGVRVYSHNIYRCRLPLTRREGAYAISLYSEDSCWMQRSTSLII